MLPFPAKRPLSLLPFIKKAALQGADVLSLPGGGIRIYMKLD